MDTLRNKYPIAIIPKDTVLFRKAPDEKTHETMFFGIDTYAPYGSDFKDGPMQIWVTTRQIEASLIVKGKKSLDIYENDLEYCYEKFCGEKLYYLEIKHRDNPQRPLFLDFLKQNQIDTWVTSAENKTPIELFLFKNDNKNFVKFLQFTDPKNDKLEKDSYHKIILVDPITRNPLPDMYVKRI